MRIADGSLTREGTPLRVGLIQGNIAQEDKWNPREARRIFTTYIADDARRGAPRRGVRHLARVVYAVHVRGRRRRRNGRARPGARGGVPILLGSDQVDRSGNVIRLYNAAFLITPEGETGGVYRKIHLVPFGEHSVQEPAVFRLAARRASRRLRARHVDGDAPGRSHQVNTAICYEVVYPSLIREAVLGGSQLLTTITNDGWYGDSSAPYQHFELASMRAIEQGRYLCAPPTRASAVSSIPMGAWCSGRLSLSR